MPYSWVTLPPQSLRRGKVTPIWSAKALLAKALSMLTPKTWVSEASSLFKFCWKFFICCVQPPVKAEDIERQDDILLAAVVAQLHVFEVIAVKVFQREIRRHVADFRHARTLLLGFHERWGWPRR